MEDLQSQIPELNLEQSGDIFTLRRGVTPCSCWKKPPIPVSGNLGKLELISSPCQSICPMFNMHTFSTHENFDENGNKVEGTYEMAGVSLHCAEKELDYNLVIYQAPSKTKSRLIN